MTFRPLLTEEERQRIFAYLVVHAPDDRLLDFVNQVRDDTLHLNSQKSSLMKDLLKASLPAGVVPLDVSRPNIPLMPAHPEPEVSPVPIEPENTPAAAHVPAPESQTVASETPPGRIADMVRTKTREIVMRKMEGGPATAQEVTYFLRQNGQKSADLKNTEAVLNRLCVIMGDLSYSAGLYRKAA